MIVFVIVAVAVVWLVAVAALCAALRHATRPPWWETTGADIDTIDVV